ncbi:SulP family inorganic anion transporter [Nocardia seriolae]|uniref:carbonic anhydrase n=1 Tax=Nocardia seriolae TaxID=37332 RepID=A0ABC8AUP8_9NOCA|nr:SulP family inorganic anion transporter [Nocardia seriolae]APA97929.1 Putative sulfate transporter YvdB [Nocardia seriolae]OJF79925.1 carbonic anhydrase [Nocardia seriolae]PSK28807.1 carbonic anhydrase [Nocardia seriolae]QOW36136.1 bifunctional SulP family inorganic anion transporter/carbonic anhydrase [Nocardia seriolae]QUN16364.1 bifunctional SulP family inorganic anion transporter/carbonic anhydrase [Nocardia seriolae]
MSTDTDQPPRTSLPSLTTVFRHDLPASLVVFLVSLPLSIGIAVAAGAPVAAGLIAAVVGGVVAGLFGGSTLQVSGPTASLTVVVAESINQFGWAATCFITVLAGGLQILFGLSRIARAVLAIAPVVVHAMLAGIGIVIALEQVHVLMGGDSLTSSWDALVALPHQLASVHAGDLCIGLVVIAILVGWRHLPEPARKVPAPLVAVVVATGLARVLPVRVEHISIDGSLLRELHLPQVPHGSWAQVALMAVTIGLIASVETLLSAVAVDRMRHNSARRTDLDRELLGQGAANMVSGLIGGLPVAAVIVRSITNVKAGARTKVATMLHGVWILLFSVALVGVVRSIPKAALAGLLIVVGIQLIKLAHIRRAQRTGDLVVYAATAFVVVFWNLLLGMLVGLALAFALLLWRVVRVTVTAQETDALRWRVSIDGSFTFLALPELTAELAKIPPGADAEIELTVDFMDHAACDALQDWAEQHRSDGGTVEFIEVGAVRMADAADGPPARGHSRHLLDEVLGPWRRSANDVDRIVAGVAAYHRSHAHVMRPHLGVLRDGQEPDSLFVTCADSRVVPNVITSSGPGDLFTVRNVGNLIPRDAQDSSMEAALIYALDKLDVRSVVVCGHSGCGAMGALHGELVTGSRLDDWLAHARPSLERFRLGHPVATAARAAGFGPIDQLGMVNVAVQLETLYAHPVVRRGVEERGVVLSGLFFDIATARVVEVTVDGIGEIDGVGRVAQPA